MSSDRRYEPIDCSLHDRLESAATLRTPVSIVYRTSQDEVVHIEDRIIDVFARDGVEFLKVAEGTEIRLDDVASVDGVASSLQVRAGGVAVLCFHFADPDDYELAVWSDR